MTPLLLATFLLHSQPLPPDRPPAATRAEFRMADPPRLRLVKRDLHVEISVRFGVSAPDGGEFHSPDVTLVRGMGETVTLAPGVSR